MVAQREHVEWPPTRMEVDFPASTGLESRGTTVIGRASRETTITDRGGVEVRARVKLKIEGNAVGRLSGKAKWIVAALHAREEVSRELVHQIIQTRAVWNRKMSPRATNRVLGSLERKGLIRSVSRTVVQLTRQGERVAAALARVLDEYCAAYQLARNLREETFTSGGETQAKSY